MEYPSEEIVDMLSEHEMRNVGEEPPKADPLASIVEFFHPWSETKGAVLSKWNATVLDALEPSEKKPV